jgi:hypothetical protein
MVWGLLVGRAGVSGRMNQPGRLIPSRMTGQAVFVALKRRGANWYDQRTAEGKTGQINEPVFSNQPEFYDAYLRARTNVIDGKHCKHFAGWSPEFAGSVLSFIQAKIKSGRKLNKTSLVDWILLI